MSTGRPSSAPCPIPSSCTNPVTYTTTIGTTYRIASLTNNLSTPLPSYGTPPRTVTGSVSVLGTDIPPPVHTRPQSHLIRSAP